jgi:single-strand DNA-binding protein
MSAAMITITGNVGKDVELRFAGEKQIAIATFNMAHTPRIKKDGEFQDGETMWFKVVTFMSKAEAVADQLQKGDTVLVTGSLTQSTYLDKEGKERTVLEIKAEEVATLIKRQTRFKKTTEDNLPWD